MADERQEEGVGDGPDDAREEDVMPQRSGPISPVDDNGVHVFVDVDLANREEQGGDEKQGKRKTPSDLFISFLGNRRGAPSLFVMEEKSEEQHEKETIRGLNHKQDGDGDGSVLVKRSANLVAKRGP